VDVEGRVDRVRLTKSLDAEHGLDETAKEAAKQWRFEPGRHAGRVVPVYVTLVLAFRVHD
jgi:TonB family protein